MVRLTRSIEFCSSLRYERSDLSRRENERLFGRHSSRHGHNYRLEVSVVGEPDPITGMVMNISELKAILEREVEERFDHRDLNDDTPYFEKRVPTPENLALVIRERLVEVLPPGRLAHIRLHQGDELWVDIEEEPSRA